MPKTAWKQTKFSGQDRQVRFGESGQPIEESLRERRIHKYCPACFFAIIAVLEKCERRMPTNLKTAFGRICNSRSSCCIEVTKLEESLSTQPSVETENTQH